MQAGGVTRTELDLWTLFSQATKSGFGYFTNLTPNLARTGSG